MNIFVQFVTNWVKAGIIAWLVWFVTAVVYMFCNFKLDMDMYGHLDEILDDYKPFHKQSLKKKFHVLARSIVWPWGLFECSNSLVQMTNAVLEWKRNRYLKN